MGVIMLSVTMLSVIMLSVIMLSVMGPVSTLEKTGIFTTLAVNYRGI